jgi:hypothetical protein
MPMLSLVLAAMIQQSSPSVPPPPPPFVARPPGPGDPAPVELPMPTPLAGSHYKGLRFIYGKAPAGVAQDLGLVRLQSAPGGCTQALTEVYDRLVAEAERRGATAAAEVRTDPDNAWNVSNRNFICRSATRGGPNSGTVTLIARLIRP